MNSISSINNHDDSISPGSFYINDIDSMNQASAVGGSSIVDLDELLEDKSILTKKSSNFTHKITLIVGGAVLLISVMVVVVALSVLTAGIPQSIILGGACAGIFIGGASFIKSFVGLIYNKIKSKNKENSLSENAKKSLLIGVVLSIVGFVSKIGSGLIPGGYGQIVDKFGSTAYDMGVSSVFNALTQLIYNKLFVNKTDNARENRVEENKQKIFKAALVLTIGIGFAALGIALLIVGSVALVGTGQVIALMFATPLLAVSMFLIMRYIVNFPWKAIKELLEKVEDRSQTEFLSEFSNVQKDVSDLLKEDVSEDISETEDVVEDVRARENIMTITSGNHVTWEKQIALFVAIFLLLVGLAFVLTSIFVAGPAFQATILLTIGGTALSVGLPVIVSGISAWLVNVREKNNYFLGLLKVKNNRIVGEKEYDSVEEDRIIDLKQILNQQKELKEKYENKVLVILSVISILLGIGFLLLALIPGISGILGIISLSSPFLLLGGLMFIEKTIALLRDSVKRSRKERKRRLERISRLPNFVRNSVNEVINYE